MTADPATATKAGQVLAENGRVLATLDDWRAIMFVLVAVLIIFALVIVYLLITNRSDRKDMSAERTRMWGVSSQFGSAAEKLRQELAVQRALNARIEQALEAKTARIGNGNAGRP